MSGPGGGTRQGERSYRIQCSSVIVDTIHLESRSEVVLITAGLC